MYCSWALMPFLSLAVVFLRDLAMDRYAFLASRLGFSVLYDNVVDVGQNLCRKPLPEVHQKRRIIWYTRAAS